MTSQRSDRELNSAFLANFPFVSFDSDQNRSNLTTGIQCDTQSSTELFSKIGAVELTF
jgi:hypothetical protein